jgi:aryl carrier-like protein
MTGTPTPSIPTPDQLSRVVADTLGLAVADLEPDANLVVLGLSSLEIMRLVGGWRRDGLDVDFDRLVAAPTLAQWQAVFAELDGSRAGSAEEASA